MEKNTGKTECLNYIIKNLKDYNKKIAVTSIGVDGENIDIVSETPKPEIEIYPGVIFITSEKHYHLKRITAEILDVSHRTTSLGRLVTAEARDYGKLIFSGPSQTFWLKEIIEENNKRGVDIFIVDGALSRKSSASPSITESMILTTGAALSHDINLIIKKTSYLVKLIRIKEYITPLKQNLLEKESGLYIISKNKEVIDTGISSGLLVNSIPKSFFEHAEVFFVSGILTDKFLENFRINTVSKKIPILVKDFTKIFVNQDRYNSFIKTGGEIMVLLKPELITVCVNPVSPFGYKLDSTFLVEKLSNEIHIPVYDIKKI